MRKKNYLNFILIFVDEDNDNDLIFWRLHSCKECMNESHEC